MTNPEQERDSSFCPKIDDVLAERKRMKADLLFRQIAHWAGSGSSEEGMHSVKGKVGNLLSSSLFFDYGMPILRPGRTVSTKTAIPMQKLPGNHLELII